MIFAIIALILFVLGILAFAFEDEDINAFGGFLIFIAALGFVFGSLLPTGIAYSHQISDQEAIVQYQRNAVIYSDKSKAIINQIKDYLSVQYPDLEKKIFGEIAGHAIASDPKLFFAAYPQLRSSNTFMALTNEIAKLTTQIYNQQLNVTQDQKNIRTRRRNLWFLTWFLP